MHRILTAALAVLFATTLQAEVIKGKVKEVNPEKHTITLTVAGKEQKVAVDPEAIYIILDDNKARAFKGGLKALKPDMEVILVTCRKEDKEVAGVVKVKDPEKK